MHAKTLHSMLIYDADRDDLYIGIIHEIGGGRWRGWVAEYPEIKATADTQGNLVAQLGYELFAKLDAEVM